MERYWPYPEYKDSGVDWLGEIPEHWNAAPLRHILAQPLSNGLFKKREHWGEGTKIVNVFDVYKQDDLVDELSLGRVVCDDSESYKYSLKHGDFVFVRSSLKLDGIGKSAFVINPDEPLVFECHLVRGRPDARKVYPKFLCYFLNSGYGRKSLISLANQVTMATLDQQKFKNLCIATPPIPEQSAITHFLDHKTAQIDALIAKKELLLEKLAEKRIALISHAVTKGLNPRAKMKDSGVEWLGQVPVHWISAPLRHFLAEPLSNGLFKKREHWGGGTKIVNVFDVYAKGDVVNESSLERVACDDSELEKYSIKHGDFVFVRSSLKLDGIGKSASVLNPVEPLVFECHLVRGRPDASKIDPKFLCYFLNSSYSRESLVSFSNQVTMATLDQQKFKQLVITVPPILEQLSIANFLDVETTLIDDQMNKVIDAIEKLGEYRSALITQAVTGKIDVRNIQVLEDAAKGEAA